MLLLLLKLKILVQQLLENEKYTANIGEAVYTVAPGLKAKVTYTDYEYKDGGTTNLGDDSGQITQLTLSASF